MGRAPIRQPTMMPHCELEAQPKTDLHKPFITRNKRTLHLHQKNVQTENAALLH